MARLGQVLDLEQFLLYMAAESVTLHWDGYESPNNWRMYFDPVRERLLFLPTGVDYTWHSIRGDAWYGRGDLFEWCLENSRTKALFDDKLTDAASLAMDLNLALTFQDLSDWLDPEIQTDPRTPHSARTIADAREETLDYIQTWPPEVIRQVERQ